MYMSTPHIEKHNAICNLFKSGIPATKIGSRFNITRERVRQILNKYGVVKTDGGFYVANEKKKIAKKEAWLNKIMRYWGITKRDWLSIRRDTNHAEYIRAFKCQRNAAPQRGIDFNLTYWEWKKIWDDSGLWEKRGRGKNGYCMARKHDIGPYAVGNVDIIPVPQNSAEGFKRYWDKKRLAIS